MKPRDFSRREFLRKSALGASAFAIGVGKTVSGAPPSQTAVIGFIGVGGRGTHLLRKMTRIGGARIGAVCDLRPERVARAQKVAADHKPKGYTDFRKMLDKEKLDAVVVATEVGNHAKCVIPVLEAGLHCFSEKPMDATVEKVDAVVKAARKAKGFYQIGTQRRYNKGYVDAIKRIHSGEFGEPTFLQGQWQWTWQVGPGGWVWDVDISGGELVEQAVHHMDVMSWVMKNQPPLECVAMAATTVKHNVPNPPRHISEDHSAVIFRFPGNVIFSYTHLFYCPDAFTGEKLWVYGTHWGVDLVKSELYKGNKKSQISESSGTDWDKGTDNELEAFVDNVLSGGKKKPAANVETGRVATLMALMGQKAFRDLKKNKFESRVVKWEDLGSTT